MTRQIADVLEHLGLRQHAEVGRAGDDRRRDEAAHVDRGRAGLLGELRGDRVVRAEADERRLPEQLAKARGAAHEIRSSALRPHRRRHGRRGRIDRHGHAVLPLDHEQRGVDAMTGVVETNAAAREKLCGALGRVELVQCGVERAPIALARELEPRRENLHVAVRANLVLRDPWVARARVISLTRLSCPFTAQFATTDMTPSSCSGRTFFATSGSPMAAPFETVGKRPPPSPNSFIFWISSAVSEIAVGSSRNRSGRAARTRWISGVAFASGGVNVSSTTSWSPSLPSSPPSFIGFTNATEAAVLSMTMPTRAGFFAPAAAARSSKIGSDSSAWRTPFAEL